MRTSWITEDNQDDPIIAGEEEKILEQIESARRLIKNCGSN